MAANQSATDLNPAHRWVGYGGVVLAGDSWGDPGRRLVALLHGGGQTRHAWKNTGTRLAAVGYHVVAFDARGHGDSEWDSSGLYTQDARVADLQAILAAEGASQAKPVVIGASMGGVTGLIGAGEGKVDLAALVLVDIAPHVESDGAERIRSFMGENLDGFETLEDVADAIARYQPHRTEPPTLEGLRKNVRLRDDGKYHWHWDPNTRVREVDPHQRRKRLEECARNLRLPTLLVRGGRSDLLSDQGAKEFLALCPHAEYENIEGAAHMVVGDRNDAFGNAAVNFLLRVAPPI
jgi:non-heme chloroperoxidase